MRYGNEEAEGLIEQAEAGLCGAVQHHVGEYDLKQ
jgi:hypothetical protein